MHLNGASDVFYGRVTEVAPGELHGHLATLVQRVGVQLSDPAIEIRVETQAANQFAPLDWFGFTGVQVGQQTYRINDDGNIWKLSLGGQDLPWAFVHLFAGAFQGWHQALEWLSTKGLMSPSRHIAIDNDPAVHVAQVWGFHEYEIHTAPLAHGVKSAHSKVGVLGDVADHSWYNLLRENENIWLTMSPPCQSWSGGGFQTGLNCENGFRFVEAVEVILRLRPLIVTGECGDRTPNRPHFKIIRSLFVNAGYKLVWTAIGDHSQLVGMARRKWLAVYIRQDVQPMRTSGNFRINGEKISWSHESFSFFIPKQVEEQLFLTPSLLDLYGTPNIFLRDYVRVHHCLPPLRKCCKPGCFATMM